MKLNDYSYVHKKIRLLCYQLGTITNTQLITDLSKEFDRIVFIDRYGYIIINYHDNTIATLCNRLGNKELDIIEDIMSNCDWLETGNKYAKKPCNKNVTFIFEKNVDKQKSYAYNLINEQGRKKLPKKIIF